jgi:SET domain-containing protein
MERSDIELPFEIRPSPTQGLGAFATRFIPAGVRLIEYAGDRLTPAEADARYPDVEGERHHTYLFAIDDDVVIDAAVHGNEARFINHSCDPNCEAVITGKKIFIHALRGIEPGEELAYDYQYERTGENDAELEKFYVCKCGADNCRGSIMKPAKRKKRRSTKGAPSNARARKT